MKKTFAILCACFALSAHAIPTLSELADRVTSLGDRYAAATNSLAQYRAENTTLLESIAQLHVKMGSLSNAVALIESKCETDASWRRIYHQGLAGQAICTNAYGIIYRVDIFNDGYVVD